MNYYHVNINVRCTSAEQSVSVNVRVRKLAKIRNSYNQVPHLTKDTTWESDKNNKTSQTKAKRSARGSGPVLLRNLIAL